MQWKKRSPSHSFLKGASFLPLKKENGMNANEKVEEEINSGQTLKGFFFCGGVPFSRTCFL